MRVPKFKVGDFIMPVLDTSGMTKMQVIEINIQICDAGIEQIFYVCRVSGRHYTKETPTIVKDYFRFNEVEVVVYQPEAI